MIYKKLKQYAPERLSCAYGGILMSLVSAVFMIISYYYIYHFFKQLITDSEKVDFTEAASKIVIYLVAGIITYFGAVFLTHVLAFRLETNLKKEGIRHIMNSSFSFFDKNESGRVRKIIDDNTVLTHMSVAHLIPDLSTAVFIPVLGIGLSFYVDWRLGLLFTAKSFS